MKMTNAKAMGAVAALGVGLLVVLAAVPSQTDFSGTYFQTNTLPISLVGSLTNWAKLNTNIVAVGDSSWTNGFDRVYNVKLFGAVGNGATDDTAAIQSAIDACDNGNGGTVYFPNGTYKITGTNGLTVANANLSHGGQHYVSLRGESANQTVLSYSGPTNGFAVVLRTDKNVSIDTLSIHRNGARGTTGGLLLTGPSGGTQSNGGYIRNVGFDGWHVCIDAGPDSGFSGTSSEWVFDSVSFNTSDIGFANFDFNGLDFMFRMLQCANVTTNVYGATAGISVDGGSFSNCGTAFYCRNGGLFSIRNVRSEVETGPFVDSASTVLIENCLVNVVDTNAPAIALSGGNATIKMCQLGAYIGATNTQSLDIEDTGLNAQSVATIGGSHGQETYLRNYQTAGQTSTKLAMLPDSFQVAGQSPSRAAAFDANTNLVAGTTTLTELNLLSGASSPIHSGAVGDGLTNSAGTIKAAIYPGGNMTFSTNAGAVTISASGTGGSTSFANPTASAGLSAVNGSSTNAMRADAAPALDVTIAPTWTGAHTFSGNAVTITNSAIATAGVVVNQAASATNAAVSMAAGGTSNFKLYGGAADTLELRNGSSPQTFNIYNTTTSTSQSGQNGNYSVVRLIHSSNTFYIQGLKGGSGSAEDFQILPSSGNLLLCNTGGGTTTINNGLLTPLITKTTNYTAAVWDRNILLNGTTLTLTLPTAAGHSGQDYVIKLIANSTATVATTSSQNIDGATTYSLSAQYKFVRVVSDGSQWWIIGQN